MCIKSLSTDRVQRCAAWEAEARRAERSCFLCRRRRKVCDVQVVVPMDRRAQETSDRRVVQHAHDLLNGGPGKAKQQKARWKVQDRQRPQCPAAPPTRPARPPPALQPGHVAMQQQQQQQQQPRPMNGYYYNNSSSSRTSGRPVGQQRIAIPMSKYSTLANARPSPMPQVPPPPPPPTAPVGHRPTRERRATQHPVAAARNVSPIEQSDLRTFTPSPVSPVAMVKVRYGKSYFDID
ncbi:hypothetical protein PpBr36_00215 [Pyricularia pennisetigena]|uniref:hypothetical protein n=1 Tax=Pyricularia pennisetigena TaxID=1578925 RepID=UPI001150E1EF|nr:hypothetical protein PpBr36_00215 [Pyricularia pennisetigena]TLS29447.1 hypothetical protein PpBr36_00215 [Pyricularia pennisetigena]